MGSCRVGFRPGLCRSPAPARRRASRAWQDGLAAWASHWAGCQGAMVGRRALVVVWARSRRGHDAWAVAWVGRRRAWPSCVTGRRVALSDGSYWFLAPNRFFGPGRQAHRGWSSSWCGVARPSLRSVQICLTNLVSDLSHCGSSGPRVRLEGLSSFGSVDGRGRGARGPRALAPLHLRG